MKFLALIIIGTTAACTVAGAASANDTWYVTAGAGADLRFNESAGVTFTNSAGASAVGTNSRTFDPGVSIDLAGGRRLSSAFAIEANLGYRRNSIQSVTPSTPSPDFPALDGEKFSVVQGADRDQYTLTANLVFTPPITGPLRPYVGAGFGAAYNVFPSATFLNPEGTHTFRVTGGNAVHSMAVVEAGVSLPLGGRWFAIPSYRFEHLVDHNDGFSIDTSIFELGLRRTF